MKSDVAKKLRVRTIDKVDIISTLNPHPQSFSKKWKYIFNVEHVLQKIVDCSGNIDKRLEKRKRVQIANKADDSLEEY